MSTYDKLATIWSKDYISSLPEQIKDRGFCFSLNNENREILITGFNPSFREGDSVGNVSYSFDDIMNSEKYDNYWGPIKKMICNLDLGIDLRSRSSYLDIFNFREKEQAFLKKNILTNHNGIQFVVDQMNLTQHVIEDIIKPKLIIVKNRESSAYWGKLASEGIIWMGYEFEFVKNLNCGELFRITGLLESSERIAPEIKNTNLEGTFVLFTDHINQYTTNDKRPTPLMIKTILDFYNL